MATIYSDLTGEFRATITDACGREVLSFNLVSFDRFILSSVGGEILSRKLNKDDLYWSKATLAEVIKEMMSKKLTILLYF
ncbi:hypothetical protein [Escherichia sp. E1130]|uniref:hypothetical protein n=1 Tax=Escherichia sp. E1130 TaxID=2041645 RepID=UPI001F10ABE1|nr:hypothetical protein [Escherichia sp. E1130]